MFVFGSFLFSVVPLLILVVFVIALMVFIMKSKERSRQLDGISRKLDTLIQNIEKPRDQN